MNQLTQHQGKNTFKSLVGLEIQEVFPLKEDDQYIDEIISKKLNLNNFYDVADSRYWDEYQGMKSVGAIEEKLLRNYMPVDMVCGFHQFFYLKHKELIAAISNPKSFQKSQIDGRQKAILAQYRRFVLRFWQDNHFKFYSDLPIFNELITAVFDCSLPSMVNDQLLVAQELLEVLKVFSSSFKLNTCLDSFPKEKKRKETITSSYKDTCSRVLDSMVTRNLEKIPEIVSDSIVQRKAVWMGFTKVLIDLSNEVNQAVIERSEEYFRYCENCLTQVFLNAGFHKDTAEANDIVFYALSMFSTGLFWESDNRLMTLYIGSKPVLFDIFLSRCYKWSRSVFEAFCVLLHVHDGEFMRVCYMKLPRYRVLRDYQDKGMSQVLGPEVGGPFEKEDMMEAVDKIEDLRYVANPDVQAMIENYCVVGQTIY
jgi:hypothetical protein